MYNAASYARFQWSQVQDVGLIFLSAMATSIAHLCEKNGYDPHEALGTSLLTLAISTFIVGFLIVLVGIPSLPIAAWFAGRVTVWISREFKQI